MKATTRLNWYYGQAGVFICLILSLTLLAFGKDYAILIGVRDYKNPEIPDLSAPENDVILMKKILMDELDIPPTHITTLVSSEAMYTLIKSAVVDNHNHLEPEDFLVFYFSGHGSIYSDNQRDQSSKGKQFLLPYEAKRNRPGTFIKLDDLAQWLRHIKARKLIILDACYAGGGKSAPVGDPKMKGDALFPTLDDRNPIEQVANSIIFYASSSDKEGNPLPAFELEESGKPLSAFTYYFCQTIQQTIRGSLTTIQAVESVNDKMKSQPNQASHPNCFQLTVPSGQIPPRLIWLIGNIKKFPCRLRNPMTVLLRFG